MKLRIKEIRKNLNLTQEELASLMDTSVSVVNALENQTRRINGDWIEKLCKVMKIEPWMLFMDPAAVLSDEDRNFLALYHAASTDTKRAVDRILKTKED